MQQRIRSQREGGRHIGFGNKPRKHQRQQPRIAVFQAQKQDCQTDHQKQQWVEAKDLDGSSSRQGLHVATAHRGAKYGSDD
jgi:hypothetical protein